MGSGFNPFNAIKGAIKIATGSTIVNAVKQILHGKIDKAIGTIVRDSIQVLGIKLDDEYEEVTQVDSKMYNLLGSNKPNSEILTSVTKAMVYNIDMLQSIRDDLFNDGFVRINSYVQWAKRNNIYSKIGFNTVALQNHISDHEVLAAIKSVLGDVDYYPNTGDVGKLEDLRFQLGLAYCGKHNISLDELIACELVSSTQAEVILKDNSKIVFNLSEFNLNTQDEYAVCIYRTYVYTYVYIASDATLADIPFKSDLGVFTKTFREGETGYSTYSVQEACEDAGVAKIFTESFTYEEHEVTETIEPTEEELEENPDAEPTEVTYRERTYTLTYLIVDYDSSVFDPNQDVYYELDPSTGSVIKYTKTLIPTPTSNWSSYWYKYGSGLPTIDALWLKSTKQSDTQYTFLPILPVRTYTTPITQELFPAYYPVLTKSCKKIFKDRKFYSKLVTQIESNAQASHIDFAHLLFGVPFNRKEEYSVEYLCKFFIYISSYGRYFQTQEYAGQFNPVNDYGTHVSLYYPAYQKRLGYWCNMPDSITANLNWSLFWDECYYDTFFAGSAPKNPYWIEDIVADGGYRLSGETANVGIIIYGDPDPRSGHLYASYVTNMTLNTSLFSADLLTKGYSTGVDVYDSDEISDSAREAYAIRKKDRSVLLQYAPWVIAGKLSTRNWHICSPMEISYLQSKYGLFGNPADYINSRFGTSVRARNITPSTWDLDHYDRTLTDAISYDDNKYFRDNPSTDIMYCSAMTYTEYRVYTGSTDGTYAKSHHVIGYPYYGCEVPFGSPGMNIQELSRNKAYFFNVLSNIDGISPLPSGRCLTFNRQISGTYCERAYIYNLNIQNEIIPGFAIVYNAHNYLNSVDGSEGTCPFVIPINLTVMKQMSMVHRNEVLQVSYNLLFNIFVKETIRIPWYATSRFKTVCLVARIVVSAVLFVITLPAGGQGTTAFNAVVSAVSVVTANVAMQSVISAIVSRIIIAIVAIIVTRIVGKITGNEFVGMAAGIAITIIGSYTMSSYDAAGNKINSTAFSWDKLYTNVSNKITEFISSPKDLAELAISGANKYITKLNQGVQQDYMKMADAYKQFQATTKDEAQKLYELEAYNNSFRNTNFASTLSTRMLQNPYQGARLNTTLADSTAIYALSQSKVYNMYEITINVKNYV